MSARVALLRMEKDGLIRLPAPLSQNGRGQRRFQLTAASAPQEPVRQALQALEPLVFERVPSRRLSQLWNELIARYHEAFSEPPMAGRPWGELAELAR